DALNAGSLAPRDRIIRRGLWLPPEVDVGIELTDMLERVQPVDGDEQRLSRPHFGFPGGHGCPRRGRRGRRVHVDPATVDGRVFTAQGEQVTPFMLSGSNQPGALAAAHLDVEVVATIIVVVEPRA